MPLVRGPQNWLTGTRYDSGDPMSGNVANCSPPSSGNFDSPELAVISESIDVLSRGVPHWRPLTFAVVETRRSEEHTSELQSRFDLVCRLLLEKKKKKKKNKYKNNINK